MEKSVERKRNKWVVLGCIWLIIVILISGVLCEFEEDGAEFICGARHNHNVTTKLIDGEGSDIPHKKTP